MLTLELAALCALAAAFGASVATAVMMIGRPIGFLFVLSGIVSLIVTVTVIGSSHQERADVAKS